MFSSSVFLVVSGKVRFNEYLFTVFELSHVIVQAFVKVQEELSKFIKIMLTRRF